MLVSLLSRSHDLLEPDFLVMIPSIHGSQDSSPSIFTQDQELYLLKRAEVEGKCYEMEILTRFKIRESHMREVEMILKSISCKYKWWCIHPGFKVRGQGHPKSKTEATNASENDWSVQTLTNKIWDLSLTIAGCKWFLNSTTLHVRQYFIQTILHVFNGIFSAFWEGIFRSFRNSYSS